jgi:ankyrin repeat protein
MEEDPKYVLESLIKSLVTLNSAEFMRIIVRCALDLNQVHDVDNNNLLHELAKSMTREPKIVEFIDLLISSVISNKLKERHSDNYQEILKDLLNSQTSNDQYTPLHYAIMSNRKLICKKFISLGADISLCTNRGQGVMHLAASSGNVYLLTYFTKELGLDFNVRDSTGETPLHIASAEGQDTTAILLIAWSSDLNLGDSEGLTPLHMAAFSKNYRIIRHLLMSGSNISSRDSTGKTPLDIAMSVQAPHDIIKILKDTHWCSKLNPMNSPLQPVKETHIHFIAFILLFIGRYGLIAVSVLPSNC